MKTLIVKSFFFLTLLFVNNCFGTDDDITDVGVTFLEKYDGVVWTDAEVDEDNEYVSYFRLNDLNNKYLEDWYRHGDCFEHSFYDVIIKTDTGDLLTIEYPSEGSTLTFSVNENIMKVVIVENGQNDISFWNKSSTNVDGLVICTEN